MKLRNKKTGKIIEYSISLSQWSEDDKEWYLFGNYDSIDELKEEWENYKPKEPLIKDPKIRKAVRAWADVNDLCGATYSERPNGCAFIFEHADGDKTVICFRLTWLSLEKGKGYTIDELCGEEEE